jgi:sterol desaturase/sphingolipid hydroxylase (fatty acid hydroxylase superfamily)
MRSLQATWSRCLSTLSQDGNDPKPRLALVRAFIVLLCIGFGGFGHAAAVAASDHDVQSRTFRPVRHVDVAAAAENVGVTGPSIAAEGSIRERLRHLEHTRPWMRVVRLALEIFYDPFERLARNTIFTWPLWAALALTLALERLIPAEPGRKILSVSLAHDLAWFFYEPVLTAAVLATYITLLEKIYEASFSWLTVSSFGAAPGWVRFTLALLLVDLCYWGQHVLNHKIPFLWKFHAVHHSQRQLNFFTDFRYHPFEYIIRHTFLVLPFLFLRIDPPVIVAVAVVKEWYSRFYHGNIRTNLGPLKYVLVTPQSHRVHHSLDARHRDVNFGAIFSFWDFLFGKQYRRFDEYPETGIEDDQFPHERAVGLKSLILTPWRQMLHPLGEKPLFRPRSVASHTTEL